MAIMAMTTPNMAIVKVNPATLDGSGRIVVAGSSHNGGNYDMVIWRYE